MNFLGVIDNAYRGNITLIMKNSGETPFAFNSGDRLAQLIVEKYAKTVLIESDLNQTSRGSNGFGSTGLNENIETRDMDFLQHILDVSDI